MAALDAERALCPEGTKAAQLVTPAEGFAPPVGGRPARLKGTIMTDEPTPKMGRPSLYDPKFCDMVVEDMGQGYSLTAFAGLIGVNRSTITEWMNAHPDFSAAVTRGKAASPPTRSRGCRASSTRPPPSNPFPRSNVQTITTIV